MSRADRWMYGQKNILAGNVRTQVRNVKAGNVPGARLKRMKRNGWRKARMNEKVCCNCRHNIRKKDKDGRIECECDIDNSYIGYVQCMSYKCRHWAKDKKEKAE